MKDSIYNTQEISELLREVIKAQKSQEKLLATLTSLVKKTAEYSLRSKELQGRSKAAIQKSLESLRDELMDSALDQVSQLTLWRLFELDKQLIRKSNELFTTRLSSTEIFELTALITGRGFKKTSVLLGRESLTWWDYANSPTVRRFETIDDQRKAIARNPQAVEKILKSLIKNKKLSVERARELLQLGSLPVGVEVRTE